MTPPGRPAAAEEAPPLETLEEGALIEAALAGRPGAFDVIVSRHQRLVYQLCYRFAGNHEDAADLAQETFLRAYRALGRFKRDAALATWLYRIAVNVSLNARAARKPVAESLDEHALPAGGPDALSRLVEGQRAASVRRALARLPRKQRATLVLRAYQELSHKEIAAIVGTSVGAVKANVFHALKNLRKLLGNEP